MSPKTEEPDTSRETESDNIAETAPVKSGDGSAQLLPPPKAPPSIGSTGNTSRKRKSRATSILGGETVSVLLSFLEIRVFSHVLFLFIGRGSSQPDANTDSVP